MSANLVDGDYSGAVLRCRKRGEPGRGAKQCDENMVLPFDALEACLDVSESCVGHGAMVG